VLDPLADDAGNGLGDKSFSAVLADDDDTCALRVDGAMFTNTAEDDPLVNPTGDGFARFVALVLGKVAPDLASFKNPQPKASPYTVKLREGQPASVPVLVSDVEKLPSELVVTVNPDVPLPPGVLFVEKDDGRGGLLRTLDWDGLGPKGPTTPGGGSTTMPPNLGPTTPGPNGPTTPGPATPGGIGPTTGPKKPKGPFDPKQPIKPGGGG